MDSCRSRPRDVRINGEDDDCALLAFRPGPSSCCPGFWWESASSISSFGAKWGVCRIWRLAGRGEDEKVGTEVESSGFDSLSKRVRPNEKRGVDANCCCGWGSC